MGEPGHHEAVQVDADSYRALARSSPWRWRSLHFTRRTGLSEAEAWVRRPGELLVRVAGEADEYVSGLPYSYSTVRATSGGPTREPPHRLPQEVAPLLRPDGLVAERPSSFDIDYDDPMYGSFQWVAMLDPVELSDGVDVADVRSDELLGRAVWWARLRAVEGYEPRCGCCALLWSEVAALGEYGDEPDRLARFRDEGFPAAHDVALDVETGVVVALEPDGGPAWVDGFTVKIHDVDEDVDAAFAGRRLKG